jgi:lysophospholipase L1-like esterase
MTGARRWLALGPIIGLTIGLAGPLAHAQAPEACDVPAYLLVTDSKLPKTAAAIAAGKLDVLVLGSRSSTLNPPEQAFPARLEAMLRDKLPKVQVSVTVDLQPKKTTEEVAIELARIVAARKPTLMIWQTGTVDAMRAIDPDEFRAALEDGVSTIKAAGTEALLMNLQYSPRTETMISAATYIDNMRVVAQQYDIPLFDRFAVMRNWSESGDFDLSSTSPSGDLAQRVHDCLARALLLFIMDAARTVAPQTEISK